MAVAPITDPPRSPSGGGGPPPTLGSLSVLEALRRQWYIALVPVILLCGIAVAIGLEREPEYTSEARLNVGGLNLTRQSIEGYTAAVQQLAVAYARSVDAAGVVTPAGRKLRRSPVDIADHVSATPIQGSSVIRVIAKGDSAGAAEGVADATADSLVDYAIKLNSGRTASDRLLQRFRTASRELRAAKRAQARAKPRDRDRLQTRVDTARLQMNTTSFLYTQSQAGQATTELVQKLAPASHATNDRGKVMKDLLAAALVAGLLIGVGLAVARANAIARRRLGKF